MQDKMEYLQNISAVKKPDAPAPKKYGWLIGVIVGVLVISAIIVVAFMTKTPTRTEVVEEEEEPLQPIAKDDVETLDEIYDNVGDDESLNDEYAEAVKGTDYANYEADFDIATKFADYSASDICLLYSKYCSDKFKVLDDGKKVAALNSKSLDYYLDNDYIVAMVAKYKIGEEIVGPYTTIIYGRGRSGVYDTFDADNTKQSVYLSRAQLFDDVEGVPAFYVVK
jgi:hypothetical protein